jgi:hypothetical protein
MVFSGLALTGQLMKRLVDAQALRCGPNDGAGVVADEEGRH